MGIKERKEREKEARRQDILEAAKDIFFSKGFQAATMDQIAEAAELSKGSLYLHFASKEELYVTILVKGLDLLYDRFQVAVRNKTGWDEKIRSLGRAYYAFYIECSDYFEVLFLLQHGEFASRISAGLYQTCFDKGLSVLRILAEAIQEGIAIGDVKKQDPMKLAVLSWGFINGVIGLYSEEEHRNLVPIPLDELINSGINLAIDGMKVR